MNVRKLSKPLTYNMNANDFKKNIKTAVDWAANKNQWKRVSKPKKLIKLKPIATFVPKEISQANGPRVWV